MSCRILAHTTDLAGHLCSLGQALQQEMPCQLLTDAIPQPECCRHVPAQHPDFGNQNSSHGKDTTPHRGPHYHDPYPNQCMLISQSDHSQVIRHRIHRWVGMRGGQMCKETNSMLPKWALLPGGQTSQGPMGPRRPHGHATPKRCDTAIQSSHTTAPPPMPQPQPYRHPLVPQGNRAGGHSLGPHMGPLPWPRLIPLSPRTRLHE